MHKSVAEHIDLIPDEHELIFRKPKSLYLDSTSVLQKA